jgi:hypothetical protein
MQPERRGPVLFQTMNESGEFEPSAENQHPPDRLTGRPQTLVELLRRFEHEEARENPDVTVATNSLAVTDTGLLRIPGVGDFAFTDWSKRQAANLLRVRYDTWLKNAIGPDCAETMNRRFTQVRGEVRLRTMKPAASERHEAQGADGVLRAFVPPRYSVAKDSSIAKILMAALLPTGGDLPLLRFDLTERSTSFVVAIGTPATQGEPAGKVGDVQGGILVRNSGVAWASLFAIVHLTQLTRGNGMTAPIRDAVLLRKRHRGFQEDKILEELRLQAADIPKKITRGIDRLVSSEGRAVKDVEREVEVILQRRRLPSKLQRSVMQAYALAPIPSAFGVAQAMSLAAASFPPEERLDLELTAGTYLTTI